MLKYKGEIKFFLHISPSKKESTHLAPKVGVGVGAVPPFLRDVVSLDIVQYQDD
jgi:hypothetical protein